MKTRAPIRGYESAWSDRDHLGHHRGILNLGIGVYYSPTLRVLLRADGRAHICRGWPMYPFRWGMRAGGPLRLLLAGWGFSPILTTHSDSVGQGNFPAGCPIQGLPLALSGGFRGFTEVEV